MPGFNVPLNVPPEENTISLRRAGFPNALDKDDIQEGYVGQILTHREITMERIANSITDKEEWDRKLFDQNITAKWRKELLQSGQDVTERMIDYTMQELRWKAEFQKTQGFLEVFDDGVTKSDTTISKELQIALNEAVAPLENVPGEQKDYHPGSNNTVVDLVHPSLYPVIYGKTRVLPDRLLGLHDCLNSIGEGEAIPVPPKEQTVLQDPRPKYHIPRHRPLEPPEFSTKFQWLPCEVELADHEKCQIQSYINNAHPVKHKALYQAVEGIIERIMPLWEVSLQGSKKRRIPLKEVEYEEGWEKEPEYQEDADEDAYQALLDKFYRGRRVKVPEPPAEFNVREPFKEVDFRKHFPKHKFQIIVKLANIELTPENPRYEGGSWHIEGQLNERIAASAIYYYDSKNITSSSLSFRTRADTELYDLKYDQDQHQFLQQVYGFPDNIDGWNEGYITQERGSIEAREGRLITFPNTIQHRVSSFSLEDPTQPGHRKILALFLVDPYRRIISSANVPPQQEDWKVTTDAEKENANTMTLEEAKKYRLELMEERGLRSNDANEAFENGAFNLCEH
ncbi:DUF4246 domain-containing protein [Aspergillus stella-maris]|uniref:DUF4246 domain-containing protein n=1 Tax=Aspergillus stella-maris TaxID=1810926 RepID=UPI003CCD97C8